MNRITMKALLFAFILLLLSTSAQAGMIALVVCNDCGYQSDELFLDTGMMGGVDYVPAYCSNCHNIISVDLEAPRGEWCCPQCDAGEESIHIDGDEVEGESFQLHCPKCGSTNIESERVGFWD